MQNLFFELIRVSIGTQDSLSRTPSAEEWDSLCAMAKEQGLEGICFAGIQKLISKSQPIGHPECIIPEMRYIKWMHMAVQIQQENQKSNAAIKLVRKHFEAKGFDLVLLKGQGNLCNYPTDLNQLRCSGDIDAWAMPKGFDQWTIKERLKNDEFFLRWLWKQNPSIRHCYLHVIYPSLENIDVEVHFRPSYINARHRDARLQRWMMKEAPAQIHHMVTLPNSDTEVAIPTTSFNLVFQLTHIYRHIFDDGLALRQILDFFFLLKEWRLQPSDSQDMAADQIYTLIQELGVKRICAALMYILQTVFGLEDKYMLCTPNASAGEHLLKDLMSTGAIGFNGSNASAKNENGVQRFLRRQKRNLHFLGEYPEEVLSVPIYRIYQEIWRMKMNLTCK